jgi:hypothetical protein
MDSKRKVSVISLKMAINSMQRYFFTRNTNYNLTTFFRIILDKNRARASKKNLQTAKSYFIERKQTVDF